MEIGIRLHDTSGSNLEEHLRNAREQGFSCVHIAMSKVVPGFKMADAPELLRTRWRMRCAGCWRSTINGACCWGVI